MFDRGNFHTKGEENKTSNFFKDSSPVEGKGEQNFFLKKNNYLHIEHNTWTDLATNRQSIGVNKLRNG